MSASLLAARATPPPHLGAGLAPLAAPPPPRTADWMLREPRTLDAARRAAPGYWTVGGAWTGSETAFAPPTLPASAPQHHAPPPDEVRTDERLEGWAQEEWEKREGLNVQEAQKEAQLRARPYPGSDCGTAYETCFAPRVVPTSPAEHAPTPSDAEEGQVESDPGAGSEAGVGAGSKKKMTRLVCGMRVSLRARVVLGGALAAVVLVVVLVLVVVFVLRRRRSGAGG